MTDDAKLIERLRAWADTGDFGRGPDPDDLRRQAASRIEALIAERDRAYELLDEAPGYAFGAALGAGMDSRLSNIVRETTAKTIQSGIRSLKDKTDAE